MKFTTALIPLLLASGLAMAAPQAHAGDGYLSIRLVSGDFHPVHYRHDHGYYYKHRDRHSKWNRHYRKHHKHHKRYNRHFRKHARHHRYYNRHHDYDRPGHRRHERRGHDSHGHRNRSGRVERSRLGIGYTGRL